MSRETPQAPLTTTALCPWLPEDLTLYLYTPSTLVLPLSPSLVMRTGKLHSSRHRQQPTPAAAKRAVRVRPTDFTRSQKAHPLPFNTARWPLRDLLTVAKGFKGKQQQD
ncbi:hypothetical protein CB1_000761012 [Camelus ferus]|nr:hypothetical protein CB1_000761012 [Camelus ferus]